MKKERDRDPVKRNKVREVPRKRTKVRKTENGKKREERHREI